VRQRTLLLGVIWAWASSAGAQLAPPPRTAPPGLVIATSPQLASTLRALATAYRVEHPEAEITVQPIGSDVAMAALYTHRADLAVIGRDATDPEAKAFEWIYLHPPASWALMRGSVASAGHSPAIGVLVNAANPLRAITPAALRAVFRDETAPSWGAFGVTGPRAMHQIHPILPDTEQGTGRFLRHALFADATAFAWPRVREVTEPLHRDDGGARIAALVAKDPDAIALTGGPVLPGTRRVPLLVDGVPVALSAATVGDGRYPLARNIRAYGERGNAGIRAFLRFVLGDKGRAVIARGPYLPLDPAAAEAGRTALDAAKP
jgi:phosphate transport system substrate-binding protein